MEENAGEELKGYEPKSFSMQLSMKTFEWDMNVFIPTEISALFQAAQRFCRDEKGYCEPLLW